MKNARPQTTEASALDKRDSTAGKPRPGTKLARIADALVAGDSLTSGDVWRRFGHSRLAAAIHELHTRYGMQIHSQTIEVVTADGGISHIAEYSYLGG